MRSTLISNVRNDDCHLISSICNNRNFLSLKIDSILFNYSIRILVLLVIKLFQHQFYGIKKEQTTNVKVKIFLFNCLFLYFHVTLSMIIITRQIISLRETCLGNYFWHCGALLLPQYLYAYIIHARYMMRQHKQEGKVMKSG